MAARFHSAVHRRDEVTYLKLVGVIDEDNELGSLADQVGPGTLIVDLSEVERINSCGVRDWVNWLGKVEKLGGRPVLVECSPPIVAQVNLVHNFTGGGVVKSFYAPYFCPTCDREKILLIETRDAAGRASFRAPSCRCDECDGPMDFDDMEDSYFAFLANSKKVVTDARVDEVVHEFTPSDGSPKLRARTLSGTSSSGGHATSSPQLGSIPSAPTMSSLPLKAGGEVRPGPTTGRNLVLPLPLGTPPPGPARADVSLASQVLPLGMPVMPAPPIGRAWMLLAGVLVLAALALLAYLFTAGPPSPVLR